jgi:hypothetical protein
MTRMLVFGPAALLLAAACGGPRPGAPRGQEPEGLEGSWTLELRLEHPVQLGADTASLRPVRGEVVLLRAEGAHYGSHTLDVRPFGIALPGGGHVPTVRELPARGDSVVLVLEPDAPGGGLTLAGRMAGDSAAGQWWWYGPGRSASASGRFTLRRGGSAGRE